MEKIAPFILLAVTFVFTAFTLKKLIPILKGRKIGQKILEIGPRWHASKEGTPTMGGLGFVLPFTVILVIYAVLCLIFSVKLPVSVYITAVFALLNSAIGVIDDSTKFANHRNEGLKAWQKMALQLVVTALYICFVRLFGGMSTEVYIPFVNKNVDFGLWFYPFAMILIVGIVNSVNLADGIDGLASSETAVVGIFYLVTAYALGNYCDAVLPALCIGCALGFLTYNFYPARVFMGDTGSLFFGALVVGIAFATNNAVSIIPVGIMYIIESVSDILQVGYFKLTHGKRLFRMAPIHHHFEKCGWSEIKIVAVFTSVTVIMSVLTFILYRI